VPEPAILDAVLEPAVDVPAHRRSSPTVPVPAVSPAVPEPAAYGVYPLIILIVYVIVTGGILCSRHCGRLPTTDLTITGYL